jgi:hypothetical protein
MTGDAPGSYPGEQSSSLWRRTQHGGVAQLADAAASSTAQCGFESRLPYAVLFGAVPIRSTGRTARSGRVNRGSNPRWAAMPPRTAAAPPSYGGWPGSAPGGGSMCSYSNLGREASPRCWMLRVRIPPSARLLSDAPRAGSHAVVAQLGQSISPPRRRSPVRIGSAARMPL